MKLRGLILIFLTALASIGFAQDGPPPKELMVTKRILLAVLPKIQTELKITSDQRTRIFAAFGDSLEVEGDRIKLMLTGDQNLGEMEVAAMKVLDSVQQKRLEEVWLQRLGGIALGDEAVAKRVGLTADQKKEVDGLIEGGGAAIVDLMRDGPDPSAAKQVSDIRKKVGIKAEALLTDSQKRAFEGLKGKPFDMKQAG